MMFRGFYVGFGNFLHKRFRACVFDLYLNPSFDI